MMIGILLKVFGFGLDGMDERMCLLLIGMVVVTRK